MIHFVPLACIWLQVHTFADASPILSMTAKSWERSSLCVRLKIKKSDNNTHNKNCNFLQTLY